MVDEEDEIEEYRLTFRARRWLREYLPCWGSSERPPGRLTMKDALEADPSFMDYLFINLRLS